MKSLASFFILLFSVSAWGATATIDFSNRTQFESGDLIFNQGLGVLHPSLRVMNFKGGFAPLAVDVGDGRHGSFDSTTYSQFSMNGDVSGNVIRIDTSAYPTLQVTNFILDQGWSIEVIGNNPLIIYSLQDVQVVGDIFCQGEDGANAVGATPGMAGAGRCGGGNGGDGGSPNNDGTHGGDTDTNVTGGRAGNFTGGAAVAGGGGGSWNTSSASGTGANVNGGGGQAGNMQSDPEFLTIAGGAGGGGGSGTATEAGAGGGGGGGAVIIHAVRDFYLGSAPSSTFGRILVSGGDGGDSNVNGGAGGGGAGGSIQVFVGRNIEIYNTDGGGASRANAGTGGQNVGVENGGNGGIGRSWFSSVGYNLSGTGFYTPAEQAPVVPGNVEFNSTAQSAVIGTLDLRNTRATVNSFVASPSSSDFTLEVSGSDDNFISDDTGFTTDLTLLREKRYLKLRATIATTSVNNPDMLDSIVVNFSPGNQEEFEFTATSCALIQNTNGPGGGLLLLLLPFLFLFMGRRDYLNSQPMIK